MEKGKYIQNAETAKEFLAQIIHIDKHINALLEELDDLRARSLGVTSMRISDMPRSNALPSEQRGFFNTLDSILFYEAEVQRELNRLYQVKFIALSAISTLPTSELQLILKLKFFDNLSNIEIAETLNISESNVKRKIHTALSKMRLPISATLLIDNNHNKNNKEEIIIRKV